MEPFDAWHIPLSGLPAELSTIPAALPPFDDATTTGPELRVARLSPGDLRRVSGALQEAGETLRGRPIDQVIAAIDAVARRFLDRDDALRAQALAWLPRTTGLSPAMAELVLDRTASDWLAPLLRALIQAELRDPRVLERFVRHRPGQYVRAFGPRLAFHVLAGNVPGVGVTSLVRSLLVRAPALCKTAREEPVMPVLFARALHTADPELGSALAVTWWPGGDLDLEDAALANADLVVHYGGREAVTSLAARIPRHVRLVEHGPRISFGIVAREKVGDPRLPAQIARATATFDQQGCVSPHLVYVEHPSHDVVRDFARRIAEALAQIGSELSRGRLSFEEASLIRAVRAAAEFRQIGGAETALFGDPSLAYTVIYDARPDFVASCLNRTLWCRPISSIHDVADLVRPFAPLLQSVAVAASRANTKRLAEALGQAGASRVTCFESLPWPAPTWHHDGRGPLRELLRWVDLERS
ncbi:MAG TPA: acyl-CoA reductase [Longimicrobiales bacterium]|nr:acyl-CoA reductase [Longimicrobiales bacterium]